MKRVAAAGPAPAARAAAAPTCIISRPAPECIQAGGKALYWRESAQSTSCLHVRGCADGQQGPGRRGAGHAGRGRNAARWLSSLRALLLCWLPAALLHWRHAQRALASELSSGMPDDHDTALHSTRVQPIRPINLARAGADGPEPRRQVHLHCAFEAFPQSSFGFREIPTLWLPPLVRPPR